MGGPEPLVSHLKLFSLEKAGFEFWSQAASSRRWVGKFLDERFGSLIQLHVPWSENLKILKWVGFIAGAPLPPHLLVLHSRQ
jgi:hypothetical protein